MAELWRLGGDDVMVFTRVFTEHEARTEGAVVSECDVPPQRLSNDARTKLNFRHVD